MYRLIAYLGVLGCIIIGGILGLFVSVIVLATLDVTINNLHVLIGIALGALIGGALAVIHVCPYIRKLREKKLAKYLTSIPENAGNLIKAIIKQMRYRRKVRRDVTAELIAHFEDALRECTTNEEKGQKAGELIEQFGDAKLLGVLLRRAKKRCRPLWRTVVARGFQAVGVLILCLAVYLAWFLTGKPNISVDYLAILNQMNRPQITDEDNAWLHYEKAIELYVEPNESLERMPVFQNYREAAYRQFDKLTGEEQREIREWVEQNNAVQEKLAAGSLKRYCYRESRYNDKDEEKFIWNIILWHVNPLSGLAKAGIWQSRIHTEEGKFQQAIKDCLTIIRVGRHWQNNKAFTAEQLFGRAMSNLGHNEILNILTTEVLSAAELKQLQQELSQIYLDGYPLLNANGYREMFLDVIQHLFTEGGLGGGHLIPERFMRFEKRMTTRGYPYKFKEHLIIPYIARSIVHARRDETIAKANEILERQTKLVKISPYEKHTKADVASGEILKDLSKHKYHLLRIMQPLPPEFSKLAFEGKVLHKATITILAILRYEAEKGNYPETLEDIMAEGYLNWIPTDPYSSKPLIYKKMEDDFQLYSVGLNFEDDGGKVGKDRKDKPRLWADEGDVVFWPIQDN